MEMVATAALHNGMELAEDVYSYQGKLLLQKDCVLDAASIRKLEAFQIMSVNIKDAEDYAVSYAAKIRAGKNFKRFQDMYRENLSRFKDIIDAFIFDHKTIDPDDLLDIADSLTADIYKGRTLLDILLNMMHPQEMMSYAHSLNVALICKTIGGWFGFDQEEQKTLTLCGFLYDIGKFLLPADIIWKPTKLTPLEFDLVRTHAFHGYHIIKNCPLDQHVKNAALQHHERCDGSGYPQKLKDLNIDPYAKIIAIIDVYEAMTSARSYRSPICPFQVIATLEEDRFQKYDTSFIMTFLEHIVNDYLGNMVHLNDGREGEVVFVNKNDPARPMIRTADSEYVDLSKDRSLSIEAII